MFAPAEKFAEMLEETGASRFKVGTAQDVSNKDNAGKFLFYVMKLKFTYYLSFFIQLYS